MFTQKKLDRINFRSGNGGRVLRNPPGVTRCWSRAWSHDSLRSHSEISRVEPLSDIPSRLFSVYLSDLAIRFSVFRQTLSDITLDRSKVKLDKLLCVNTALVANDKEKLQIIKVLLKQNRCCARGVKLSNAQGPVSGSIR